MKLKLGIVAAAMLAGALIAASTAAAASSPTVQTGSASHVKEFSAVLGGSVNPDGQATSYGFQWGPTNAYGVTGAFRTIRSGRTFVAVLQTATNLNPGSVYHYRLIAVNGLGTTVGRDRTFKTAGNPPPAVATGQATTVGTTVATVTGTINPNGQATTWEFQYGTTATATVQTIAQTLPAGSTPATVSVQLTGLTPGTWFFYHLVALHGSAVVQSGAAATFLTEPSPRPAPRLRASTAPRRTRRRPYAFTTSAKLLVPPSIPASLGCVGTATIRYLLGNRRLRSVSAAVQPNCTVTAQTAFKRLPGRGGRKRHVTLRVLVGFSGNGYLAPVRARAEHIVLG